MTRAQNKQRALDDLRRKAACWRGCPLADEATQIVFGAGPATARLMFIGEAPSYYEDKEGVPFVGPAGAIFNKVLARARLDRDEAYVTNVEKFKHSKKMGRNQPPKQSEIDACRPWLLKEIAIVQPEIICCLGALAARWVLGKDFRLMRQHGEWLASDFAPSVLATIHPAVVLNRRDEDSRAEAEEMLLADIRKVARRYRALGAERRHVGSRAA